MWIETRANGVHICGYVNSTGKKSRPVMTPHGRVIEEIMPGAFERAIKRSRNINATVDHGPRVYARTSDGSLKLKEDKIGLYADMLITDQELIEKARNGRIRGWSFSMQHVRDRLEGQRQGLPIRKVYDFDMDHITLVVNKFPMYLDTSVELKEENEAQIESRWKEKEDIEYYKKRLEQIEKDSMRIETIQRIERFKRL